MKKLSVTICLITVSGIVLGTQDGSLDDDDVILPDQAALRMRQVAPTTRPWHVPDDSLNSVNSGYCGGVADRMISIMNNGLTGEYNWLKSDPAIRKRPVTQVLEALYKSGDSPQITNILHQALLAPTNYYRDATFHAYVMASPVPMTFLAETVVKRVPAEQRRAWYNDSRRLSFKPAIDAQYIDRPSREALRFAHFLFTVKQIESDPECLRAIGNPVDPKWECQQERKDEK